MTFYIKNTYYIPQTNQKKFHMKKSTIFGWILTIGFTCCLGHITSMPNDWSGIRICCLVISSIILAFSTAQIDNYSNKRLSSREKSYETKLYLSTAILAVIILMICCITNCANLTAMEVWMISLIGVCIHRISHNDFA